jgi:hypothetical protein
MRAAAAESACAIVSIHLSPELSGIYSAAQIASQIVDKVPIQVVDCRTAAMGQDRGGNWEAGGSVELGISVEPICSACLQGG